MLRCQHQTHWQSLKDRAGIRCRHIYSFRKLGVRVHNFLLIDPAHVDHHRPASTSIDKLIPVWKTSEVDGDAGDPEVLEPALLPVYDKVIPEDDLGGRLGGKEQTQDCQYSLHKSKIKKKTDKFLLP